MLLIFVLIFNSITASIVHSFNISLGTIKAQVREYYGPDWNYDLMSERGPLRWFERYPECGWNKQSPVNIISEQANIRKCHHQADLELLNYDIPLPGKFENNAVQLLFRPYDPIRHGLRWTVDGKSKEYQLEKIIFHWGNSNLEGSEHALDGKRFPFEIQFYHRPSHGVFTVEEQRIAIAVFGQLSYYSNKAFDVIEHALVRLSFPDDSIELRPPVTFNQFLPSSVRYFYQYNGSYTYPPCMQEVTWLVLKDPIQISGEQLRRFRQLYVYSPYLYNNFRPITALNDRHFHGRCIEDIQEEPKTNTQNEQPVAAYDSAEWDDWPFEKATPGTSPPVTRGPHKSNTAVDDGYKWLDDNRSYRLSANSSHLLCTLICFIMFLFSHSNL